MLWNVFGGTAVHVRAAVVVSALIMNPAAQVGCDRHEVPRLSSTLYVLAPHAEHVRKAVLVSALILKPAPHVGCAMQTDAPPVAYSLTPHATLLEPVHLKPAGHEAHALLLVR